MSKHLKRLSMPKSWPLERKGKKYIIKVAPGAHNKKSSLPLLIIMRDLLKLIRTSRELKKILNEKKVLVNGKVIKKNNFSVGFYDIITIPVIKKNFRVIFDKKRKLSVEEISEKDAQWSILRVEGKNTVKKGKLSLRLSGGKNKLTNDKKIKVGGSVVMDLKDGKIKEYLELKEEAKIILIKGKYTGHLGKIKKIGDYMITIKTEKEEIKSQKNNIYVIK